MGNILCPLDKGVESDDQSVESTAGSTSRYPQNGFVEHSIDSSEEEDDEWEDGFSTNDKENVSHESETPNGASLKPLGSSSTNTTANGDDDRVLSWNCQNHRQVVNNNNNNNNNKYHFEKHVVVKDVADCYSRQEGIPAKFETSLLDYERQCLAFMIDIERDTKMSWNGKSIHHHHHQATAATATATATADTVVDDSISITGGWLLSETGVSKTGIVTALITANPWNHDDNHHNNQSAHLPAPPVVRSRFLFVKTSIIITSEDHIEKWEKECKLYNSCLKILCCNSSTTRKKLRAVAAFAKRLERYDIIIIAASTTANWNVLVDLLQKVWFHRVIVDGDLEITLACREIASSFRWIVTPTPNISGHDIFLWLPNNMLQNNMEFCKTHMFRIN